MASISQVEIDRLLISFAKVDWRKTAFIIAKVLHDCEAKDISLTGEEIFDRILSLCNAGNLESQGVLQNWRGSEVRLPVGKADD
jgi:hypothetical protein